MNKYTLQFRSSQLEEKFKKEVAQTNCVTYLRVQKLYFSLIGIPNIIVVLTEGNYEKFMEQSLLLVFQVGCYFLVSKYRRYINLWITILNLAACGYVTLQFRKQENSYYEMSLKGTEFYFGAIVYIIHITTSFLTSNLIMTFTQTIISFLLYFFVLWTPEFNILKYTFVAIHLLVLLAYYENQKNFRQTFLLRDGEREWMQLIKKGLLQNIITVQYCPKDNNIKLDLINQHAQKEFNISNAQQFTAFSRKVQVFDQISDYKECSKEVDQRNSISYRSQSCQKNTLENKIIYLIKQHLNKKKDSASSNIINQAKKEYGVKNKYVIGSGSQEQNHQTNYFFYGVYKTSQDVDQIISIRVTVYRFKTQYFCCLVLSQKTQKIKIKSLEEMNVGLQNNLFQLCKTTGERFQSILANIQNQHFVKAVISQGINQLYNYRDHGKILKNQFKIRLQSVSVSQISLEQFQSFISSRYLDKINEIDFKFQFKNCNSSNQIRTYIEYIYQVLMNLIDNSIKSLSNCQSNIPRKSFNHKQFLHIQERFEFKQQNSLRFSKQILANRMEESKMNNFLSCNMKSEEISCCKNSSSNQKEIHISIELLKGENQYSDIFKVSVIDQGRGMSMSELIYLLEIVDSKNLVCKPEYQSFSFLGWKNNFQIIGQLGPFYNFYIKSNTNNVNNFDFFLQKNGLEYHFYVYQNIEILDNFDNGEWKIFQNSLFDKSLIESNNEYIHINNFSDFKEKTSTFNTTSKNLIKSNCSIAFSNIIHCQQQQVQGQAQNAFNKEEYNSSISICSENMFQSNFQFQKLNTKFIDSFTPNKIFKNKTPK